METVIFCMGGSHTIVDFHANYAKQDMFAVFIPFQILILSAVQGFSKNGAVFSFYKKKSINVIFYDPFLLFCARPHENPFYHDNSALYHSLQQQNVEMGTQIFRGSLFLTVEMDSAFSNTVSLIAHVV